MYSGKYILKIDVCMNILTPGGHNTRALLKNVDYLYFKTSSSKPLVHSTQILCGASLGRETKVCPGRMVEMAAMSICG